MEQYGVLIGKVVNIDKDNVNNDEKPHYNLTIEGENRKKNTNFRLTFNQKTSICRRSCITPMPIIRLMPLPYFQRCHPGSIKLTISRM